MQEYQQKDGNKRRQEKHTMQKDNNDKEQQNICNKKKSKIW